MVSFQQIYEEYFKNLYKPVWKDIADKRFFQEDQTLANIGRFHSLTRERVRQLEFLIRHSLYNLLSVGTTRKSYTTYYKSPAPVSILFGSFMSTLQSRDYILFPQVVSVMEKFSKSPIDSYWLKGLMKICGYNFIPYNKLWLYPSLFNDQMPSVFYRGTQVPVLSLKIRKLKAFLLQEPIRYLTLEELGKKLQEKTENVECLLGLIPNIERNRIGYRLTTDQLFIPNAVYRILSETGRIMTKNELLKKLSSQYGKQTQYLAILSQDPRFVAVHSCRSWALAEWGLKTESVAELMVRAFQKMNKPLDAQEIHALVVKDRPVPISHIRSLLANLSYKDKFSCFLQGWGLKEWSSRYQCKPRINSDKVYQRQLDELLIRYLSNGQRKSTRELYDQITRHIKMKYNGFYNRIFYDSKILLSVKTGKERLYFLKPNYKIYLASETLKERTVKAMIQLLKKRGKILLRTAIKKLTANGFYYPTIYKHFSNAKLFCKEPLPGLKKGYVVGLRH